MRCRLYVIDLGATHGTFVNGKRLDKHKPEKLTDGARLLIGQAPFAYHISRVDGGGDKRKSGSNTVEPDSKRVRLLSARRRTFQWKGLLRTAPTRMRQS